MRKIFYGLLAIGCLLIGDRAFATDAPVEAAVDAAVNAADVESYDAEGSVFQKIADLEQEKVLMQLEKEKAQLQLDLDRLAAEQARLVREQDVADLRAEEEVEEIARQKQDLEKEKQKLDEQKKQLQEQSAQKTITPTQNREVSQSQPVQSTKASEKQEESITDRYFLREIVGAGNQLFATVENFQNGKQKKISVGKTLDGYSVKAISLDDGVELEKDGQTVVLSVGTGEIKSND